MQPLEAEFGASFVGGPFVVPCAGAGRRSLRIIASVGEYYRNYFALHTGAFLARQSFFEQIRLIDRSLLGSLGLESSKNIFKVKFSAKVFFEIHHIFWLESSELVHTFFFKILGIICRSKFQKDRM